MKGLTEPGPVTDKCGTLPSGRPGVGLTCSYSNSSFLRNGTARLSPRQRRTITTGWAYWAVGRLRRLQPRFRSVCRRKSPTVSSVFTLKRKAAQSYCKLELLQSASTTSRKSMLAIHLSGI
jgi:hypothetical protein